MSRLIKRISLFICLLILVAPSLSASTKTFIEPSEGRMAFTAPFYDLVGSIAYDFDDVRDMTVYNDTVYVVDSEGIIVFNPDGTGFTIGSDLVKDPQGIFIDEHNNEIYLADKEAQTVFVFDLKGNLLRQYDRPTEVFFGEDTAYAPVDVVVTNTDIIYIASEGTVDGLIGMKKDGSFLNFYGANEANESIYSKLISSSDLLPNSIKPKPASITNVEIDNNSVVYTMTQNVQSGVRKLNYDGNDVYENPVLEESTTSKDFVIDKYKNVFVINDGFVEVYNPQGKLLFKFTETSIDAPLQIAVSSDEEIYLYDGTELYYFKPTDNVMLLYQAADLYYDGKLEEAKELWDSFLTERSSYSLAYQSLGDYEYQNRNYADALSLYKKASSKEDYSDALFFVRQNFVEQNISYIIALIITLIVIRIVYKKFIKKRLIEGINRTNTLKDIIYIKKVLVDPKETFYEIKFKDQFNSKLATGLYAVAIITFIIQLNYSSFLFEPASLGVLTNGTFIILFILVIAVVLLTNNFISSIMYSEARLSQMYRAFSLVFVPYVLFTYINLILGYMLTLNEQVIYNVIVVVMILWMFVILYNVISEMHNYQIGAAYKNMFVTLFTIIVLVFVTITALYLVVTMGSAIYQVFMEVF